MRLKLDQTTSDFIDNIIIWRLKKDTTNLMDNYNNRPSCGVFHKDEKKDKKALSRMIKSYQRILEYYGG